MEEPPPEIDVVALLDAERCGSTVIRVSRGRWQRSIAAGAHCGGARPLRLPPCLLIIRLRRLEDRLADQQRLCNEALTANAELEARAFALERENFETTGAYRKELLARAAEAEALRLEVRE